MVNFLKKNLEKISLSRRLVIFLSIPLTLLTLGSALYDYKLASETISSAYDTTLTDVVTDLESLIRFTNSKANINLPPEIENLIQSESPDSIFYAIRNAKGILVAGNQDLPMFSANGKDLKFSNSTWDGKPVRVASHHIQIDEVDFHVTVMETTLRRTGALHNFLMTTLGPNLLFTMLVLLCVWYSVRIGLKPLEDLEKQLSKKSQADLSPIPSEGYPPEIKPILQKLNELLIRLEKSHSSQRRFLADAAHQLRTPLTCLQTNMEIFVAEDPKSRASARLQNSFTSIERMSHLVSQLLAFARAEDAFQMSKPRPLDIAVIIEEVSSELVDSALAKNTELTFALSHAPIHGVEWMIKEAIVNLIDNAIRYTPPTGQIHINCHQRNGMTLFEVIDNGPGIADPYIDLVLERFFRIPGTQGEGCGLGLSVVNQICQHHDAQLRLSRCIPHGLLAQIQFKSGPL